METTCPCGAAGRQILPGFAYQSKCRTPMMAWLGGRIGEGRMAVEDGRIGVRVCPACQERACVYMPMSDDGR
jgi:hypothetical protein